MIRMIRTWALDRKAGEKNLRTSLLCNREDESLPTDFCDTCVMLLNLKTWGPFALAMLTAWQSVTAAPTEIVSTKDKDEVG